MGTIQHIYYCWLLSPTERSSSGALHRLCMTLPLMPAGHISRQLNRLWWPRFWRGDTREAASFESRRTLQSHRRSKFQTRPMNFESPRSNFAPINPKPSRMALGAFDSDATLQAKDKVIPGRMRPDIVPGGGAAKRGNPGGVPQPQAANFLCCFFAFKPVFPCFSLVFKSCF